MARENQVNGIIRRTHCAPRRSEEVEHLETISGAVRATIAAMIHWKVLSMNPPRLSRTYVVPF